MPRIHHHVYWKIPHLSCGMNKRIGLGYIVQWQTPCKNSSLGSTACTFPHEKKKNSQFAHVACEISPFALLSKGRSFIGHLWMEHLCRARVGSEVSFLVHAVHLLSPFASSLQGGHSLVCVSAAGVLRYLKLCVKSRLEGHRGEGVSGLSRGTLVKSLYSDV